MSTTSDQDGAGSRVKTSRIRGATGSGRAVGYKRKAEGKSVSADSKSSQINIKTEYPKIENI
jgi:hypothetical protein